MKAAIKEVWLNRAEGPVEECGEVTVAGGLHVVDEVLSVLRDWGRTAPEDGGYDKTDFRVEWDNGESYEGRFDMQKGGTESGVDFWTSLKERVEYVACKRRPAHFKDEHWAHHCATYEKEGWRKQGENMLRECELPA